MRRPPALPKTAWRIRGPGPRGQASRRLPRSAAMSERGALVDRFGRVHTNLRVSVTDRCNIRCFYCMPEEVVRFKPRHELLSFEEIARFVRVMARLGVNKVRLTGGEPLVRHGIARLVGMLSQIAGIED